MTLARASRFIFLACGFVPWRHGSFSGISSFVPLRSRECHDFWALTDGWWAVGGRGKHTFLPLFCQRLGGEALPSSLLLMDLDGPQNPQNRDNFQTRRGCGKCAKIILERPRAYEAKIAASFERGCGENWPQEQVSIAWRPRKCAIFGLLRPAAPSNPPKL